MNMMWGVVQQPMLLETMTKEDLIMAAVFFGLFFLIFGLGGFLSNHIPCKTGSMLYEILHEDHDEEEEMTQLDDGTEQPEHQENNHLNDMDGR